MDAGTASNLTAVCSVIITVFLLPLFKVGLSVREDVRDLKRDVGGKTPPSGLIGDFMEVKQRQSEHHDWMIRRGFGRRRDDPTIPE